MTTNKHVERVRQLALSYPDVVEGTSCKNAAFKIQNKAFLYLGCKDETYDIRIKLNDSLPEAEMLASREPDHYSVGMHGWTHVVLPHSKALPAALLKSWVDESFQLLAPKSAVESLPGSKGSRTKRKAVKKPVNKAKVTKKTKTVKKAAKKTMRK
ncbi:MAG: MmcQ/YjbR family DNA-binding protein [Pirellulales bacterium]|nr:MmcQ/YjbR family DNA-binding protein [Pirellulales bacterium]